MSCGDNIYYKAQFTFSFFLNTDPFDVFIHAFMSSTVCSILAKLITFWNIENHLRRLTLNEN